MQEAKLREGNPTEPMSFCRIHERTDQHMDFSGITFRPLRTEDRGWIGRCAAASGYPFTALTFPSLAAWADTYGLKVAGDEDFFVIRSRHDKGYYAPCGDPEKCMAFMEETARKEHPARFVYVAEQNVRKLAERGWEVLFRSDLSEYILSTAALALEPGKAISHSFKYKCRHFAKEHPYRAREVFPADAGRLREIAEKAADPANQRGPEDGLVLEYELEHMEELGMRGVLVETEAGESAFLLGYEGQPDSYTMTMFRRSEGLSRDVTAVCFHELARLVGDRYPRTNIEEDLGLAGLRTEKMLYSPVDLLKVYEVLK